MTIFSDSNYLKFFAGLALMEDMEYVNDPMFEMIATGRYKGFTYYVYNFGTHPRAYIDVTGTSFEGFSCENISVSVHGGITYSEPALFDKKGWFIGWDYNHFSLIGGDFNASITENCSTQYLRDAKRWTTFEILLECKNAIDQLA